MSFAHGTIVFYQNNPYSQRGLEYVLREKLFPGILFRKVTNLSSAAPKTGERTSVETQGRALLWVPGQQQDRHGLFITALTLGIGSTSWATAQRSRTTGQITQIQIKQKFGPQSLCREKYFL